MESVRLRAVGNPVSAAFLSSIMPISYFLMLLPNQTLQNKLEEFYEALSRDLHVELEYGRGVEQALAAQHGIPSTEMELRQQRDEHQVCVATSATCHNYQPIITSITDYERVKASPRQMFSSCSRLKSTG